MRYEIEYSPDLRIGRLTNGAADALGVFQFGPASRPMNPRASSGPGNWT